MFETEKYKYAKLLIEKGINIKKDQILVLRAPIECAEFVYLLTELAFKAGAKDVPVIWSDETYSKIRYIEAQPALFDEFPSWNQKMFDDYVEADAAFLTISASDPEAFKSVDPDRIARSQKSSGKALKKFRNATMSCKNVWCIASVPTKAWAKKVFPNLSEAEAVNNLWQAIFKATRVVEEDPIFAWDMHKKNLDKRIDILNRYQFKSLHYKNKLGTKLEIGLPENHIWLGVGDVTPKGHEFIANIPGEEIFTSPDRNKINGFVKNALPLNLNGTLVDHFEITFENGRIVDFKAETGYEQLKALIETDEGSRYLGEVALVPYKSPISDMKILFYNTLFDENASCHLAIGKAYPMIEGGASMDVETLLKYGLNDSIVHEDFMIGTPDLEIDGLTDEGEFIPVFRDGNFVF